MTYEELKDKINEAIIQFESDNKCTIRGMNIDANTFSTGAYDTKLVSRTITTKIE